MKNFEIGHYIEISSVLEKSFLIDITVDTNNTLWLLTQLKLIPDKNLQYNNKNLSDKYEIYHIKDGSIHSKMVLDNLDVDFHFLRVLNNNEFLIVGARCRYHSEDNIDNNAVVVDERGNIKRKFILGDGIQDIKIESNSIIWTGYFDEGVYGNYGWDNPIGSCGLRSWTLDGNVDYIYNPSNYDYAIDDCYSLNIASNNEKWFYFYTEFYLGKISNDNVEYYSIDIDGGNTIAISNNYIVSDEGYGKRSTFSLLRENNSKYEKIKTFNFLDKESKEELEIITSHAYGEYLLMRTNRKIYMTSISDIKSEFNVV